MKHIQVNAQLKINPVPISKGAMLKIIPMVLLFVSFNSFSQDETQYKAILEIELEHNYFKDGYDRSLNIQPISETLEVFKANGLLFQQKGKWIKLFAPTTFNLEEFILDNDLIFQFDCIPADPKFFSYTDMGFEPGMWIFSNENQDMDSIILNSKLISIIELGPKAATINIHIKDIVLNDPEKPIQYKVKFNARKTAIRYYIIPTKPDPIALELEGELAHLFSGPILIELPNGDEAYLFDSGDNLFPLTEYPSIELNLKSSTNSVQRILIKNLPVPNPMQFIIEDQKYIVPIYVYL